MNSGRETESRAGVTRSLARAFQEKLIEPSAARMEELEDRLRHLQEKLAALEKEIRRLGLLQKKTAAGLYIALSGLAATALALAVLHLR